MATFGTQIIGDDVKTDTNCSYFKVALKIFKQQFPKIPSDFFDNAGDKCYCLKCHEFRGDNDIYKRGKPMKRYGLPLNFARFGLKTDIGFCNMNNVWNEWHAAYHGTKKETVPKIFQGRLILLKPGDVAIGDNKLGIRKGHITKTFKRYNKYTKKNEEFDPMQIYLSPSIKYASNPIYSEWVQSKHPDNNNIDIKFQFLFQVRIRPGSYGVGQETVGASDKAEIIDSNFSNNELEWYTKENIGIVLHGLLLRFIVVKDNDNIDLKSQNNELKHQNDFLKLHIKVLQNNYNKIQKELNLLKKELHKYKSKQSSKIIGTNNNNNYYVANIYGSGAAQNNKNQIEWQFLGIDNQWKKYNSDLSDIIEKLEVGDNYSYTTNSGVKFGIYKVSKDKAHHINMATNKSRESRRVITQ